MKKFIVTLISIVLIVSFGLLVYYGIRHSRGIPVAIEKIEKLILEVSYLEEDIDLSRGISQELWKDILGKEIKLTYQLMALPWPKTIIPSITVKAFHNQKDIYFYITWKDDTQDIDFAINKFSDACAIMFPLGLEIKPATILMGFMGKANIWQWKASQDKEYWQKASPQGQSPYADFHYPFEEEEIFVVSKDIPKSAANDLIAIRVGTVTPKEIQGNIQGRGIWQEGTWQVVFKRALQTIDPDFDAVFEMDKKRFCGFAVWNGAQGDRGGRKSIAADWVELVIK